MPHIGHTPYYTLTASMSDSIQTTLQMRKTELEFVRDRTTKIKPKAVPLQRIGSEFLSFWLHFGNPREPWDHRDWFQENTKREKRMMEQERLCQHCLRRLYITHSGTACLVCPVPPTEQSVHLLSLWEETNLGYNCQIKCKHSVVNFEFQISHNVFGFLVCVLDIAQIDVH